MPEPVFPKCAIGTSEKNILDALASSISSSPETSPIPSCKFFSGVVLQDFPPEILLQQPTILQVLLKLCKIPENKAHVDLKSQLVLKAVLESLTKYSSLLFLRILELQEPVYTCEQEVIEVEDATETNSALFPSIESFSLSRYTKETLECLFPLLKSQTCCSDALQLLFYVSKISSYCHESFSATEQNRICQKFAQILRQFRKHPFDPSVARRSYIFFLLLIPTLIDPWLTLKPAADILPSALLYEFFVALLDKSLVVNFPVIQRVLAHYLESSHFALHQNYQEALHIASGVRQAALHVTRAFHNVPGVTECFQASRSAMAIDETVCDAVLGSLFEKLAFFAGQGLQNEDLIASEKLVIELLRDEKLQKSTYTTMHGMFVKYLGVQAAVDVRNSEDLNFLLSSKVLHELAINGLHNSDSQISRCAGQMWTFLLKSQKFLKDYQWRFLTQEIPEILPYLQASESSQPNLSTALWTWHDSQGLDPSAKFSFVARELLQRDPTLKHKAVVSLIANLAQQLGGHRLLPKLAQIDNNTVHEAFQLPSPVALTSRKNTVAAHNGSTLETVLFDLEKCGKSETKSLLLQVNILLEDFNLARSLDTENEPRLTLLQKLISRALGSDEHCADWLPPLMASFLNMALANEKIRKNLSENPEFLLNLARAVIWGFIEKDVLLQRDALVLLSLLVHNDIVCIDEKYGIHAEKTLRDHFSFPFTTELIEDDVIVVYGAREKLTIDVKNPHCLHYWKIVWHLAKDHQTSSSWNVKIFELTEDDLFNLHVTSPVWSLEQALNVIQDAGDHEQVLNQLEIVKDNLSLLKYGLDEIGGFENWKELASLPWTLTLQKFMESQPSSLEDEILFACLLDTLKLLMAVLSENPFMQNDQTLNWLRGLTESEGGVIAAILREQCIKAALPEGSTRENVPGVFTSIAGFIQEMALRCEGDVEELQWDHLEEILIEGLHDCHQAKFYKLGSLNLTLETLVRTRFGRKCMTRDASIPWSDFYEDLGHILYSFGRPHTTGEGMYMGRGIVQSASLLLSSTFWAWSDWIRDRELANKLRLQQDLMTSSHLPTRWAILESWLHCTSTVDGLKTFCEASESQLITNLFRIVVDKSENSFVRVLAAKVLGNVTETYSPILPVEDVEKIVSEFVRLGQRKDLHKNSVLAGLLDSLAHLVFNMLDSPYGEGAGGTEEKVDFSPVFAIARCCLLRRTTSEDQDGLQFYYCLAIVNKAKVAGEMDYLNDMELLEAGMRYFCTPSVADCHVPFVREQAALMLLTFAQNKEYLRVSVPKQGELFWSACIDALQTEETTRTSVLLLLRAVFAPTSSQSGSLQPLTQHMSSKQRTDLVKNLLAIYDALPQSRNLDDVNAVLALGSWISQSKRSAETAVEHGVVRILMQQINIVLTAKDLEKDVAFDMAWCFLALAKNLLTTKPKIAAELVQRGILLHLYSVYQGLSCDPQRRLVASVSPILCDLARGSATAVVALATQKIGKDSWFDKLTSSQAWKNASEVAVQFLCAFTQTSEGRKSIVKAGICALSPAWTVPSLKKSKQLLVSFQCKLQLLANIIATPEAVSLVNQVSAYVGILSELVTSAWSGIASSALAVLCNMHFQTVFKPRLIATGTVPFFCREIIQGKWDDDQRSHMVGALWALAANCHKAKVLVRQHLELWLSLNFPDKIYHPRLLKAVENLRQVLHNE